MSLNFKTHFNQFKFATVLCTLLISCLVREAHAYSIDITYIRARYALISEHNSYKGKLSNQYSKEEFITQKAKAECEALGAKKLVSYTYKKSDNVEDFPLHKPWQYIYSNHSDQIIALNTLMIPLSYCLSSFISPECRENELEWTSCQSDPIYLLGATLSGVHMMSLLWSLGCNIANKYAREFPLEKVNQFYQKVIDETKEPVLHEVFSSLICDGEDQFVKNLLDEMSPNSDLSLSEVEEIRPLLENVLITSATNHESVSNDESLSNTKTLQKVIPTLQKVILNSFTSKKNN